MYSRINVGTLLLPTCYLVKGSINYRPQLRLHELDGAVPADPLNVVRLSAVITIVVEVVGVEVEVLA